jgi:membrane fusion protein (multidrug efflux system)
MISFVVIVAVLVAGFWYLFLRGYVSTDDAYIRGNSVSISSKMLGRIVELTVDEGDSISAGQVLVTLDSTDLKAQEAQVQAAVETARRHVDLARVEVQRATSDFNTASRPSMPPRPSFSFRWRRSDRPRPSWASWRAS